MKVRRNDHAITATVFIGLVTADLAGAAPTDAGSTMASTLAAAVSSTVAAAMTPPAATPGNAMPDSGTTASSPPGASSAATSAAPPARDPAAAGAAGDDAAKWAAGVAKQSQYVTTKTDTLAKIAKKIFGSARFWKKIWAANRETITKPHHLKAGVTLTFPAEMPSAADVDLLPTSAKTEATSRASSDGHPRRSSEWKRLPKQPWERYSEGLPEGIDSLGFDQRDKISNHPPVGFEVQAIPLTDRATILGEIFASRSEGSYFSLNEVVYIKADETLKTGGIYALTQPPSILKSRDDPDRNAYSYLVMGKVKILGVHAHIFVGRIISSRYFIPRGALLMALPAKIPEMTPTAGATSVRGQLVLDHNFSTTVTAQFKEVFIDRGAMDGVKAGNVFRAYEHIDPNTQNLITHSDFIIDADLLVTRVTNNFSSAIVIRSTSPLIEGTPVTLIKDLNLLKNYEFDQYAEATGASEDLDNLDNQDGLKTSEAKELQQLETWKGNPDGAIPETLPDSAAAGAAGALGEPAPLPAGADAALSAPAPLPETLPESASDANALLADGAAPPPLPESPLPEGGALPPPLPDGASDAPLPDVLSPLPDAASADAGALPPPPGDAGALPPPDLGGLVAPPPPASADAAADSSTAPLPPLPADASAALPPPPPPGGTPTATAKAAPPLAAPPLPPPPANGGLMPTLDIGPDAMPVAQDLPPPMPE